MIIPELLYDCGVYCITNMVNGKRYVGQSIGLKTRFRLHVQKPHKGYLKHALENHGHERFKVEILLYAKDRDLLDRVERFYINEWNLLDPENGYNTCEGGWTSRWTEETSRKRSAALKAFYASPKGKATAARISEQNRRPKSDEARAAMSRAKKGKPSNSRGMSGMNHTPESRAKMSESQKGRRHSPETIAKMRQWKPSDETKSRMSAARRAYWARKKGGA